MNKIHLSALILFAFVFIIRIAFLDTIPNTINPDAYDTLRTYLWHSTQTQDSIFDLNWNGAPFLNTYIMGKSWEFFGKSVFALRLPSAFFTSLAILVMFYLGYFITRNSLLTFIFSLSAATNTWFLNFSRSGWENAWNSFTVMIVIFGLYAFISKKRYAIGSVLIALGSLMGLYFYHPGKLFFPVSILFLIIYTILRSKK